MKSISIINLAITENTDCSVVKLRASFINLKVSMSLNHGVLLHFILLLAF